jgi:hypothetical protein
MRPAHCMRARPLHPKRNPSKHPCCLRRRRRTTSTACSSTSATSTSTSSTASSGSWTPTTTSSSAGTTWPGGLAGRARAEARARALGPGLEPGPGQGGHSRCPAAALAGAATSSDPWVGCRGVPLQAASCATVTQHAAAWLCLQPPLTSTTPLPRRPPRYANCALTFRIVDRIFEQAARPLRSGVPGRMGYEDFVWFILSEEDKTSETSLAYWFRWGGGCVCVGGGAMQRLGAAARALRGAGLLSGTGCRLGPAGAPGPRQRPAPPAHLPT